MKWQAKPVESPAEPSAARAATPPAPAQRGGAPGGELKAAMDTVRQLIQAKQLDQAKHSLELILEKNPDFAPAYVFMGNVYAGKGEYEEALEYYDGALHLKKDMPLALLMAGSAYLKMGDLDKALAKMKDAIALNPGMIQAYLGASRVLTKQERFDEAAATLQDALKHNPQSEDARLALAAVYRQQGRTEDAIRGLESLVERDEESWQARLQLARILAEHGQGTRAVEFFKQAAVIKPDNAQIPYLLGRTLLESGDHEGALREFEKVSAIDPENVLAKVETARVHMAQSRLPEARKLLILLAKGDRNLGLVHRTLAEVFMQEGRFDDAVAEFRASVLSNEKLRESHPEITSVEEGRAGDEQIAAAYLETFRMIEAAGRHVSETEAAGSKSNAA